MKKLIYSLLLMIIIFTTACAAEKYGSGINPDAPKVQIKDIMLNPTLLGKTVNIEGIIITQCQSNGCWFFLNDGTGQIFIDLAPKGFSIPPRTGKKAKVTGVIQQNQQFFQIVAHGVEIY